MSADDDATAAVPADDRGFLFGDALFETLIARDGSLLWEALHFERLAEGMERLAMTADLQPIRRELRRLAAAGGYGILRLTLSRGSGERGYAPPRSPQCRWRVAMVELPADPLAPGTAFNVASSDITLAAQPLLAGIKHCNRLEQVLAAAEARERGVDDVLLRCVGGRFHSSSRGNLFVLSNDELLTAPCDREGISGTRRRLILDQLAPALGISTALRAVDERELRAASGAFICNCVLGIRPIARFDGAALDADPRIGELQQLYRERSLECND